MPKKITIDDVMDSLGGRPSAAVALGITPQAIQKWVNNKRVPAKRVLEVERLTGFSRHELRPDFFGPAPSSKETAGETA